MTARSARTLAVACPTCGCPPRAGCSGSGRSHAARVAAGKRAAARARARHAVKLVRVDLQAAHGHECPGVVCGRPYLARIGGQFYAGTFERVWYGLTFDGWEGTGLQLDAPGSNGSAWEAVWAIVPRAREQKTAARIKPFTTLPWAGIITGSAPIACGPAALSTDNGSTADQLQPERKAQP